MGLFDNIFKRRETKKTLEYINDHAGFITAYRPAFKDWNGYIYENELVRASIDTIARHISKLKIEYRGSANGELITRLKKGICPYMTDSQFLYKLATILYINNTAFIVPLYSDDLKIIGYEPTLPTSWYVTEVDKVPWIVMNYKKDHYHTITEKVPYPLSEIGILTRHQYTSRFFGENETGLRETMKLINLQNQAIEENVKNGASYRFIATSATVLKPSDLAKERQRFTEENLTSSRNNGGILLFPRDYQNIKQIENKPYSIDSEQMKLIKENCYDYFGVNTALIQNHATADELDAFFNGLIEPFSIQAGEVLRNMIFTYNERSYGNEVLLLSNRLQYMSANQRLELSKDLLDRGILSIHEAREILNLSPIEDGDVYFIRGEYYTVNDKINDQEAPDNGAEDNESI